MKTTDSTLFEAAACWSRPGGHGVGRARLPALAPLVPPPTGRVSPTAPTERRAAERARRLGAGPIGPQPRHQMAFRPRGHYRSQRSV